MLVGNGAEMQKSFNQNRKLLRNRNFLNKTLSRKISSRLTNKQLSKETERRFEEIKAAADKKAIRLIIAVMVFLATGLLLLYSILT